MATSNTPNDEENPESVSSFSSVWRQGRRRRNSLSSKCNGAVGKSRRVKRRLSTGTSSPPASPSSSSASKSQLSALGFSQDNSNSTCATKDLLDSAVSASCWSTTTTQFASRDGKADRNVDKLPQSITPKASGRGAGRASTLFSSVMQNVQGPASANNDTGSSSGLASDTEPGAASDPPLDGMTTPAKQRNSAFSPTQRKASVPFGSPGGFQLLDFVHSVASPSSNLKLFQDSPSDKGGSPRKPPPKEWHETYLNATSGMGVIDWTVQDKIQFQCHPASVVTALVQQSLYPNPLGLARFMQPLETVDSIKKDDTTMSGNDRAQLGAAQWGSALLYWQHPALYPCPFSTAHSKKAAKRRTAGGATTAEDGATKISGKNLFALDDPHNTAKHRKLDLSKQRLPLGELETNLDANGFVLLSAAQQQQRIAQFRKLRRHEWQQAFRSLFWKWMEQIQLLQSQQVVHDSVTYFYAFGQDHAILFHVVSGDNSTQSDENNDTANSRSLVPIIIISSSSAPFREKLRQTGVKDLRLLETWGECSRDTVFREEMILEPSPSTATTPGESKQHTKTPMGRAVDHEADSEPNPATPSKAAAGTPVPCSTRGSNNTSPKVEAELAALRRAQAIGETVGAEISIKSTNDAVAAKTRKLPLSSIPPLYVMGWEDCSAFFEVYLNLTSACVQRVVQPSAAPSQFTKTDLPGVQGAQTEGKKQQREQRSHGRLQLPDDVPLLLCRKLGPFKHASLQSLEVRGDLHPRRHGMTRPDQDNNYASLDVVGGPVLPCSVRELVLGLVNTMISDKDLEDSGSISNNAANESSDGDDGDEFDRNDAIVGSHNLILTAVPPTDNDEHDEQQYSFGRNAALIIGKPGSLAFNHAPAEQQVSDTASKDQMKTDGNNAAVAQPTCEIQYGKILNMAVWDIYYPNAIAYKAEMAAANSTTFSLL